MKDPLGHGSDGRGAFKSPAAHQFKVEKHIGFHALTAAGQKVTTTGNIWQNVGGGRKAVAEKIAQFQRVDNANARVRIR
jgi:hypothetical protein